MQICTYRRYEGQLSRILGGENLDLSKLTEEQIKKFVEINILAHDIIKQEMQIGIDYYNYGQAIDEKIRATIGKDGRLVRIKALPNTIIKDNQYARAVDQKINYLLSDKPNIDSDDETVVNFINEFIDNRFMRTMNNLAADSFNTGIGWLYLFTDGQDVKFKRLDPLSVIPVWKDDNHDSLEAVILFVSKEEFNGNTIKKKEYVYFYTQDKIRVYSFENGHLEYLTDEPYLEKNGLSYSYKKLPFVYFKQPNELALIKKVKCLQDALNLLLSNYADNMFENPMNTILILKNYEGEDLGEFRENLAQYRAVKVRTADGSQGGVDTLEVTVNSENYKVIIELIKKAIAHNARSLYLDNERSYNAPNTLNIKAMYSDMELDANKLELEFTASFDYMFEFIGIVKNVNFKGVDIKFKRNIMINDESTVEMIKNSIGIISNETLVSNHPFVTDKDEELERIKKERDEKIKLYDDYPDLGGEARANGLGEKNRKA